MSSIGEIALELEAAGLFLVGPQGAAGVSPVNNFTESTLSTGLYITDHVEILQTVATSANADLYLSPKGGGAFSTGIFKATVKLGAGAVNLSKNSEALALNSASIANGGLCTIVSASTGSNIITSSHATITATGQYNGIINAATSVNVTATPGISVGEKIPTISGNSSHCVMYGSLGSSIAGPVSSMNSGIYSSNLCFISDGTSGCILGSDNSLVSGSYNGAVIAGYNCINNGSNSITSGYLANNLVNFKDVKGVSKETGRHQTGTLSLSGITAAIGAYALSSDSVNLYAASVSNHLVLELKSAVAFTGTIVCKQENTVNTAAWSISGLVYVGATAATAVVIAGTPVLIAKTAAWTVNSPGLPTFTADTVNGGLNIIVNPTAATATHWSCNLQTSEVTSVL